MAIVVGSAAAISHLPAAIAAEDEELTEVQVTGSRILQRQDYVSPNPVQTLDAEQLERMNIVNISDAVNQIPVNVSSFQPRNQGGNPFFVGSTLANLRGLNPYFGTRTLTLVDSHRFVPTNQGQSVDLNFVPSLLVSRMEVVTGGASAAYGSDAVSGVVNILLDHKLQGVKLTGDYGMTEQGDGDNYHFGVAAGTSLFDGGGNLVFGAEHQKSHSIDDCSAARKWCRESRGLRLNGGSGFEAGGAPYTPTVPGLPQRNHASDLRVNQVNAYGVIFNSTNGATTTNSANATGTGILPFRLGLYGSADPNATVVGGEGVTTTSLTSLYPDIERTTAYSRLGLDLTSSMAAFVEASFGTVDAFVTQGGPGFVLTTRCINPSQHAYLQGAAAATLRNAVTAALGNDPRNPLFGGCGPTQTVVRKDWYSQINRNVTTDTKVYRGVAGLSGAFGSSTWKWDAYYQFGRTRRTQILADNNTSKRMDMALDAVIDNRPGSPTLNQPVCRVTRDGVQAPPGGVVDPARVALAVGCVPLNIFGNGALTKAQHDYAFGELFEQNVIKQHVVSFNATGELWQGYGYGALAAAAGIEYRHEKLTNDAGDRPFYQRTDFAAQYGDPFAGTTQVKEAYFELEMPLLNGVTAVKDLRLNLAARRTSYKTVDDLVASNPDSKVSVTTWKAAFVWDTLDWLRLRGSHSRDLRAAGFRELYYSQSIPEDPPGTQFGFGGVNNPWLPPNMFGGPQFEPSVNILSGNTALKPEKATTDTLGVVLSPAGWAEGLQFSLDYYRIKLVNGISGGLIQKTVDRCYAGDQFYCSQIEGTVGGTPNPATGLPGFSDIKQLRAPYENGRPYRASGLDMTLNHRLPLDRLFDGATGAFLFNMSMTRALKTELEYLEYPNFRRRNVVGQVGGAGFLADYAPTPKWVGNFGVTYMTGPTSLTLQTQWTGAGKINNEVPWRGPDDPEYNPNLAGSIDDNTVGNYFNFNLNGSRDLKVSSVESAQLFFTVSNLLDRDPPFASGNFGSIGGTNGVFYDTLGRTYRAGFRLKF